MSGAAATVLTLLAEWGAPYQWRVVGFRISGATIKWSIVIIAGTIDGVVGMGQQQVNLGINGWPEALHFAKTGIATMAFYRPRHRGSVRRPLTKIRDI